MDDLPDLRDLVAPTPLVLRIGGVAYEVQACSALNWAKMQVVRVDLIAAMKGGKGGTVLTRDLWAVTLGDEIPGQMLANGVKSYEVTRAAWTAFYWHLELEDMMRSTWTGEAVGKAKAPTPRATRKTPTRSRAGAKATATRSPATSSATRSRKR